MARKAIESSVDIDNISINTEDETINNICNQYIQERHINIYTAVGYNSLLLYISKHVTVNRDNIKIIEYYFSIYTQLCAICNKLPSISGFSIFSNIPSSTIYSWMDGSNRKSSKIYIETFKKFTEFCKTVTLDDAGSGNVGSIYLSKAVYHMTDQPQPLSLTQNNLYLSAPVTREDIAAEFGIELSDNNKKLISNKAQ